MFEVLVFFLWWFLWFVSYPLGLEYSS